MFRNYFLVAWRNLLRYKIYSAINITGLAIGLAVCMLIVLYVGHESSYDRFHDNAKRIFWVQTKLKLGADSVFLPYLNYSAAPMVMQQEPSVQGFLRMRNADRNTIIQNPNNPSAKFAENKFFFADSNFFQFFSFGLVQGNKNSVLSRPMSVVISSRAAEKYFGTEDPVGKTIRFNNSYDLEISGVANNPPSNSTINFDFVASLSSMVGMKKQADLVKNEKNDFTTFFLLKHPAQITKVENALARITKEKDGDEQLTSRFVSTPLTGFHKSSIGDASNLRYLKIFPFVAALVLLLALINYMSLSTARSATRAKEIGVRKVMGANRRVIATQFFMESALFTAISFLLGYILCLLLQPHFFSFLQLDIDSSFLYHPVVLISFAVLFVATVLIAGTYPSLLLSAFKPVSILYGKFRGGSDISVRKFFTVVQFAIAVVFIISGIVIQKQLHFFRHKETGMKRENVVMMPFGAAAKAHYPVFREEVGALPGVQQLSVALHPLFKGYDMMGITPPGSNNMLLMPTLDVDQQFIPMLGLKWKQPPADPVYFKKKNAVVLNETAVQKLNLVGDPVGQKVDQFEVAGVLQDFNWSSLHQKIDGLLISVSSGSDSSALWTNKGGCLFAKISAGTNIPSLLDAMKKIQQKYNAEDPFEYYFLDDTFNALYKAEERLAKLLTSFTVLAIIIACLGLFGLVTFMAMQRTREIGIRKTLGASVQSIVRLLSADFIRLVVISVIIATPVAWYFMNKWLQDFAYRIDMGWWIFIAAGALAIIVAFITISAQAIKAATANPVKSLRSE